MKNLRLLLLLALCLCAFGCTYQTPVNTISGINTYSAYDAKIPGRYALVVDANPAILDITVSPLSFTGSALDFPISLSQSFKTSIQSANQQLFEEIADLTTVPTIDQMKQDKLKGYVMITAKMFDARLQYIDKFFSSSVTATAGIGFDYIIRNSDNTILLTGNVSGERTDTIDSGMGGKNGSIVLQNAIQRALREALERYAERVSNSPKLYDKNPS